MQVNASKNQNTALICEKEHFYIQQRIVSVNNVNIDRVSCSKFRGEHVDEHLPFTSHVQEKTASATKALYTMMKLKRIAIPQTGLTKLYYSKVGSIMTYDEPAWFTQTPRR